MDPEENLREAACIGDLNQLSKLIETGTVNINSENKINGWTALHWAAKRNHVAVVKYLLQKGANKDAKTNSGELPGQLTSMEEIRTILGYTGHAPSPVSYPITPNYISYPVFPYAGVQEKTQVPERSKSQNYTGDSCPVYQSHSRESLVQPNSGASEQELVLKARVAYTDEKDFIEIELDKNSLCFAALVSVLTQELGIDRKLIYKIRKLPNTILRKDKDVRRLQDFQELEVVLTNKAMNVAAKGYGDFSEGYKTEQILY